MRSKPLLTAVLLACAAAQAQDLGIHQKLARPILAPSQPLVEVKAYTATRVPPMRIPANRDEWDAYAGEIRRRVLEEVIFRGEAKTWRDAETGVEWLGTIPGGDGYRIKKLRFEAVPGLWVPALLYEPENLTGKVPVVLNVNGHDEVNGKAADYKQIRTINQAKRGLLALNVEWLGMGQLHTPGFSHARMNQLDLVGTSGLAPFYLSMSRAIDLLLKHPNADPSRVAVTGLSGGGWQTILISSLDERVALSNPVAGYSSFVTRAQFPDTDLGDSEQTPSDLATIADYTHLTALRAPRPTLLTLNARDSCCFRAEWALSPLLQTASPIFQLYDRPTHLRWHINQDPGHNYGRDNREAFYGMLRDFFFAGSPEFDATEIAVDDELKSAGELAVELPSGNLDFHRLAVALSKDQPASGSQTRAELQRVTKTPTYDVVATEVESDDQSVNYWRLRMGGEWTVPAVEFNPNGAQGTVLVVADGGRTSAAGEVRSWLRQGQRVVAIDPFYFGESTIERRDWLFSILIAALGERPLGIQAGQIAAAARWARDRYGAPVQIHAIGPRTSLAALVAGALDSDSITKLRLEESFRSLHEILDRDLDARQTPELFCFGLLQAFDIKQMAELANEVEFVE